MLDGTGGTGQCVWVCVGVPPWLSVCYSSTWGSSTGGRKRTGCLSAAVFTVRSQRRTGYDGLVDELEREVLAAVLLVVEHHQRRQPDRPV